MPNLLIFYPQTLDKSTDALESLKHKLVIGTATELTRRAIRWVETGRAG